MARYLVVAHQTSASPELIAALAQVAADDPDARFTLLVPATPVSSLLVWEEGESRELARRRAAESREILEGAGLQVEAHRVGDHLPVDAVLDELRDNPGIAGVILSTFPVGLSRWLKTDAVSQLRRALPATPITHVVAQPPNPDVSVPAGAGPRILGDQPA